MCWGNRRQSKDQSQQTSLISFLFLLEYSGTETRDGTQLEKCIIRDDILWAAIVLEAEVRLLNIARHKYTVFIKSHRQKLKTQNPESLRRQRARRVLCVRPEKGFVSLVGGKSRNFFTRGNGNDRWSETKLFLSGRNMLDKISSLLLDNFPLFQTAICRQAACRRH